MSSDPGIMDSDRTGDDLLERLRELHKGCEGDGWRPLLWACERELLLQRSRIDLCLRFAAFVASEDGWHATAITTLAVAKDEHEEAWLDEGIRVIGIREGMLEAVKEGGES
jgi:hypothetical protein